MRRVDLLSIVAIVAVVLTVALASAGAQTNEAGESASNVESNAKSPVEAARTPVVDPSSNDAPLIVFLTGDEEYRSEESMPMLARILKRDYGVRVEVLYALAPDGTINPTNVESIPGMEILEQADLLVLFTRFRDLPHDQFRHFLKYVDSQKPIVGFRTATHAFRFRDESSQHRAWNGPKMRELIGQQWITHHGHFGDGKEPLTAVEPVAAKSMHPILRGVKPFNAYSWLYHVSGGGDTLAGDSDPLVEGRSLRSKHAAEGREARYPSEQPVVWTKTYNSAGDGSGRVFFTTLGHPFDFKQESMRKLALNGILWALGQEKQIPQDGANATIVGDYDPNNSGFGDKYKKDLRPAEL
ncbi:Trehalose utilization [Stratiformator vulcanicus]|uniref:Trehalose utilization n=2 Tax=Stratiformator vulcanicus TaxID=2527980 RepID=A0A517QYT2_9PLAN|nr:Trehalose utilization [Stratiformator vulcanicus]